MRKLYSLATRLPNKGDYRGGYVSLIRERINESDPDLGIEVIASGISGNKVTDLLRRMEHDVLSRKPSLVVVYVGINDVGHQAFGQGTDKDAYDRGIRKILDLLRDHCIDAVICTPSVIGERSDGSNERDSALDQYSELVRKAAADLGVPLCDLRKSFVEALKRGNPANADEGVLTNRWCAPKSGRQSAGS